MKQKYSNNWREKLVCLGLRVDAECSSTTHYSQVAILYLNFTWKLFKQDKYF